MMCGSVCSGVRGRTGSGLARPRPGRAGRPSRSAAHLSPVTVPGRRNAICSVPGRAERGAEDRPRCGGPVRNAVVSFRIGGRAGGLWSGRPAAWPRWSRCADGAEEPLPQVFPGRLQPGRAADALHQRQPRRDLDQGGVPGSAGDGGTIAAASPAQLVIATASAASWLYYSGDGAAQWQTVSTEPDGGQGWADLGFTTVSDGVVIHGPASKGLAGQLMLTQDAGQAWRQVSF